MRLHRRRSFTLVELLIVAAILVVLAIIIFLTLNPGELLKQARDSKRVVQMQDLNKAISIFGIEQSRGNNSVVYVSIPDPNATTTAGTDCATVGLPTSSLPAGWSYHCANISNYKNIDGTGWIPVNLTLLSAGSPLSILPTDPINTGPSGFYYSYVSNGEYVLASALLESEKYLKRSAGTDGGADPGRVEVGTNLNLWNIASGLIGYWSFDETSGVIAGDHSGNGHDGSLTGSATFALGKLNNALSLPGALLSYVNIPDSTTLFSGNRITIAAWVNRIASITNQSIYSDQIAILNPDAEYGMDILPNGSGIIFTTNNFDGVNYTDLSRTLLGSIPENIWTHIAVSWDGSEISLYINGNLTDSQSLVATPQEAVGFDARDIHIGRRFSNGGPFGGLLDELRVYGRALSSAEVQSLYNATK